ncbi:hypothetical protein KEM54_005202 [Ascosphaera aggregata]|nr:hypothetical protein KEM54_005202 [Ascosphaera aggregata]
MAADLEKAAVSPAKSPSGTSTSSRDNVDIQFVREEERRDLRRGLKQRHVQMIAIAGAIGTGLFLGLGSSIATGGPLGALLGYSFVGVLVCAVQFALGEVSALFPVTGSFVRHADILVDPAWSFAIGWNVVYGCFMSVPAEVSAAVVLIQYWDDSINPAVWVTIILVLSVMVAILFIRVYGEVEFFFALLKILLVIGIIILGLVIDLGGAPKQDRLGFHYWKDPGLFVEYLAQGNWGRFLGFWAVMSSAVYSFSGIESLAMAAAETENPRQNIPKACKRVFARIVIFYVLAIIIVGMLVSSDDPRLNEDQGTAAQSPFVIAASDAGIKALPSIVNAVVLTSAWSSSNQAILSGTRTLYGLALRDHAPKIFLKTTSWGIPWMCVLLQSLISLLGYMCVSHGALTVFFWFVNLTSAGVLISWISILFNHIRLIRGLKQQNLSPHQLPWHNSWTLWASYFALVSCTIILFTGGFVVFTNGNWDTSSFVSSYLDIPLVIFFYLGYKFLRKTKWIHSKDIRLQEALDEADMDPENVPIKRVGWQRLNLLWG